jgi:trimethylguanosine synthase
MTRQTSPDSNPFGPDLQHAWDNRYIFFSRWDEGIQTDERGLYSVIPEDYALRQGQLIAGQTVLDGFSGIGGSSIGFARAGKRVTTVDLDGDRLKMAEHNAGVYGVRDAITYVQGDFFEVAETVQADTVNLDPPWGGYSYKSLARFALANFSPDGNDLLRFCFERFGEVVLRLPRNFDMAELDRFDVPRTEHPEISTVIFSPQA